MLTDVAVKPEPVPAETLLREPPEVNGGFEDLLAGWSTSSGAAASSDAAYAYEGDRYFAAGAIEEGFAQQTVDLVTAGYSPSQLDSQDYELVFGGRIRSADEAPAVPARGAVFEDGCRDTAFWRNAG